MDIRVSVDSNQFSSNVCRHTVTKTFTIENKFGFLSEYTYDIVYSTYIPQLCIYICYKMYNIIFSLCHGQHNIHIKCHTWWTLDELESIPQAAVYSSFLIVIQIFVIGASPAAVDKRFSFHYLLNVIYLFFWNYIKEIKCI